MLGKDAGLERLAFDVRELPAQAKQTALATGAARDDERGRNVSMISERLLCCRLDLNRTVRLLRRPLGRMHYGAIWFMT